MPFAEAEDEAELVDLMVLQRLPEYAEHTFEPIQVWLIPADGRPRQDLTRRNVGENKYAFAVQRTEGSWGQTWGDSTVFDATLVIVPRGAELIGQDEQSFLRRTERIRIAGPPPRQEQEDGPRPGQIRPGEGAAPAATRGGLDGWAWANGSAETSIGYNVERRSLEEGLVATGNNDSSGSWRITATTAEGGYLSAAAADGLEMSGGRVDLGPSVTRVLRADEVIAAIRDGLKEVVVSVQPPHVRGALRVAVPLKGALRATGVEHKLCVMMEAPGEAKVQGQAMIIGAGSLMRATHPPGKCKEDGGNSSRWATATFGPGPALLQWVYQGGELEAATPNIGKQRSIRLDKRWSEGRGRCLAVTIVLEELGTPASVPRVEPLFELEDGVCR